VIDKSIISRAIPRTIFYERIDIVSSILTKGGIKKTQDLKKMYFADA